MKLIFNHSFRQGKERTGFSGLHATGQEKLIANAQELTRLLSPLHCKHHPYVLVPIITASVAGEMHNTLFVCCRECQEILSRLLPYSRASFRVVCR